MGIDRAPSIPFHVSVCDGGGGAGVVLARKLCFSGPESYDSLNLHASA